MTTSTNINDALTLEVTAIGRKAREAAIRLAHLDTAGKNRALSVVAKAIRAATADIVRENMGDVLEAERTGTTKALIDRLTLNEHRVTAIAEGVENVAALPDPTGEVLRDWNLANGARVRQVRVPLGVIGMIYESRPNVTVEAAALCLKSGNAVILRGGSEAARSNRILIDIVSKALVQAGVPTDAVQFLPPTDRRSTTMLTQLNGLVDLVIARGSERMIKEISANATVPVLGHGRGLCHVYIDKSADVAKGVRIAVNAKVQRPGVCNAMETLLIHSELLYDVIPKVTAEYLKAGVEIRGDDRVCGLVTQARAATAEDWDTEFHDKIVAIKIVENLDEAIDHINHHGSGHTDSIVTEDKAAGERFQRSIDSSCVMINASTRLHDGGVFGFGSEIGISTQKLHARGTMGLRELTTTKYLVDGTGQIRE